MPVTTLTIRHDYEGGTTVEGTAKNSPAHLALKDHPSWTWSRFAGAWLLRSSRHRQSKPAPIAEIEHILTDLGYTVTRDLDDSMPSVAEQEHDLAERMEQRQARLEERADLQADKAAATHKKATDVFDRIPFGQPILVGHHSENADRNRRERAWKNLGKSFEQATYANELARQAHSASLHMAVRNTPVTVANRIETMEAEQRKLQRELDADPSGEERAAFLRREIATLTEQIDHWKGVFAQLQNEGKASTLGPDQVAKGDWVAYRGMWLRVVRVNKKSVSVPNPLYPPRPGEKEATWTIAWYKLSGHHTTEQMPPEFVTAYDTPGVDRVNLRPAWKQQ
ncbi:DUF3560 domain-containing protein [Saccharopolyspora indica]|uniref:DUF3560 domain-containing protein n=1 Tax=Saccharopolyspora indica TaxID=1229659 RepID=UPI0022EB5BE2|nr:DUF3560 domain-containing protein [Saccharopolyspora indica]MDA3644352.1 DUF3560 domain-containing protein [Saccharopolyspora indica]